MSYTVSTPGAKPIPGSVKVARALLYLCGAIQLISIIPALMSLGPILNVLEQEFADDPNADAVASFTTIGVIVGVVFAVLIGVGAIILGVLLGKGKNPARIVTWVLAGLAVICTGCGLGGTALQDSLASMGGDPTSQDIQRRITEATPGWIVPYQTVTSIFLLVALIAVIILLAVPASNEFFRKEQEVWVPPGYPTDGGQPPLTP